MISKYLVLVASMSFVLSGCTQVANNFTDGLAAAVGQGGTIARSDALEETARTARQLATGQPGTAWETVFPEEAADFVQFIDSERVLVGTLEVGAYLGVPDFKKLILYNARSGTRIWEAERAKLPEGRYFVLAVEPHIVLLGRSPAVLTLTAFDPASGRRLWETAIKSPLGHALSQGQDRLYVATLQGSRFELRAVDMRTGQTAWSQELPTQISAKDARLVVQSDGDDVYVVGRTLVRIAGADGKLLWKAEPAELGGPDAKVALLADGLIAWSGRSIALLSRNDGQARWRHSVAQGVIKLTALEDSQIIYVVAVDPTDPASSGKASDRVTSLDPKNGTPQWSREIDGLVVSGMVLEDGLLLFSLEEELLALRAASGEDHFRRALPLLFRLASPLEYDPVGQPDLLRVRDGKLHLVRESAGIVTYSLPQGGELWRQDAYVTRATVYPYSTASRVARLKSMLTANKVATSPAPRIGGSAYSPQPSFEVQHLQSQQRRLESQYRQLESERRQAIEKGENIRAAGISRAMAGTAQNMVTTANMQIAQERSDIGWGLVNSLINLQGALESTLKQTAVAGAVARMSMEIDHTVLLHNGGFQGRYYFRPFQESSPGRMQGVTLVDLDTGRRSDLVVSPFIQVVTMYGIEIPQLALDPTGERLITVGVGLKPERYEEYVAWKVRQARPSVLAYELATLSFVDKNGTLDQRLAGVRVPNRGAQFYWASKTGNLFRLQKLLDSGFDVNARDARGYTALMMAAEAGNETMTRFLVQRRANVNVIAKDKTALDIAKQEKLQKILRDAGAKKFAEVR